MKIPATRVEGNADQAYRQVVRLSMGLYGGMLARYSAPKLYKKFNSEDSEEKFFVSVVVTHDAGARQLPNFSEGFAGIRTKAFYDPGTGMKSAFVAFWEALMNGKLTAEEICEAAAANELPDLDEKIGQPIRVFLTPSTKADKNGLFSNKIDTGRGGFDKPDREFAKAILPLYNAKDTAYSTDGTVMYLTKPTAAYQEDVGDPAPAEDEEEVPF